MGNNDINRDRALFSRIAEGDEQAFEELFRIYVPQLHRIIYNLIPSDTTVRDIAQEVFLHLWLGRGRLAEVEEPQHWIVRIAYNRTFKYLKRRQPLQAGYEQLAEEDEHRLQANDTEEAVNLAEVSRLIGQAICELPPQQRNIYEMNRVGGKRPAEIAEELGISVQAVRNSLTRSGKVIRDYLTERGIHIPLILLLIDFF